MQNETKVAKERAGEGMKRRRCCIIGDVAGIVAFLLRRYRSIAVEAELLSNGLLSKPLLEVMDPVHGDTVDPARDAN